MPKKIKLTPEQEELLEEYRNEIALDAEKEAWRKLIRAKIEHLNNQLKYDWRSNIRKELFLDKYLATLRPWANRYKNKRPKGLGWLDDA